MYEYIFLSDLRALLDLSSPCVWKFFQEVEFTPLYDLIYKEHVKMGDPGFPHSEIMGDNAAFRRNLTSKLARVDDVIGVILNEFNGNVYRRSKPVDLSCYIKPGMEHNFRETCYILLNEWCSKYLQRVAELKEQFALFNEYNKDTVLRYRMDLWSRAAKEWWYVDTLPKRLCMFFSEQGMDLYLSSVKYNARHRSEPVSVAMPGIVEDAARDLIRNQHKNGLYNYKRWRLENDNRSREVMLRNMWEEFAYEIHAFGKVFYVVDDTLYKDWYSWDRYVVESTKDGKTYEIENIVQSFLHRIVPYSA